MHSRPSDVIAAQIRKHRDRLGLTREQLAQECAKFGAPELTFGALTNIETGRKDPKTGMRRRDVTVEELQVISYALAVPLLELMFPLGDLEAVPTPPEWREMHPNTAWKWAMGEEPPARVAADGEWYADRSRIGENGPTRLEAWQRVRHPLELHRRLMGELDNYRKETEAPAYTTGEVLVRSVRRIAELVEQMMTTGLRVPRFSPELVEKIGGTGLLTYPEALSDQAQEDVGE